jgi:hypothetical protein
MLCFKNDIHHLNIKFIFLFSYLVSLQFLHPHLPPIPRPTHHLLLTLHLHLHPLPLPPHQLLPPLILLQPLLILLHSHLLLQLLLLPPTSTSGVPNYKSLKRKEPFFSSEPVSQGYRFFCYTLLFLFHILSYRQPTFKQKPSWIE